MRQLTDTELDAVAAGAPDPRNAEFEAAWAARRAELEADGVSATDIRKARAAFALSELVQVGEQTPIIGALLERTGVNALHRERQS